MKKGISPVVTVVVILLVVVIVALAWYYFSTPPTEPGEREDVGIGIPVPAKGEVSPTAKEKAAEAKEDLEEERESGAAPGE